LGRSKDRRYLIQRCRISRSRRRVAEASPWEGGGEWSSSHDLVVRTKRRIPSVSYLEPLDSNGPRDQPSGSHLSLEQHGDRPSGFAGRRGTLDVVFVGLRLTTRAERRGGRADGAIAEQHGGRRRPAGHVGRLWKQGHAVADVDCVPEGRATCSGRRCRRCGGSGIVETAGPPGPSLGRRSRPLGGGVAAVA
jgi:hypothetical protein